MADCSRNAVMNVGTVKKLLRVLAAGGYDRLMLYIEDTYKVEGQPMFGYLRGAYTEEELKELDAYADSLGILLVPCMQTLAHLNAIFRWDDYASVRDCNDILLCGEEKTYALIEDMFRQLSRSLNSREIHIGMDEAWMVGLGKYLDKHGYENRFDIINRHLARVLEIAEKYGYHCCMWGDMFYHLAFHGDYYRFDAEIPEEVRKQVPKNVDLVYWDYYHLDKKVYDGMLTGFQKFGNPVIFAGGAWRWTGFAPQNRFSLQVSEQAIDSCIEHGVKNIICTAWGDNGGEASIFSVLPSVLYYGARRYGADVKADFADATGCCFDDFMTLELPDEVNRTPHKDYLANYSKVFLYNDLFLGIFDSAANPAYRDVFRTSIAKMKAAEKRAGDYRYVFSSLCALLDAVSEKYDLGVRIRAAYLAGDRAAAKELCAKIGLVIRKVKNSTRCSPRNGIRTTNPTVLKCRTPASADLSQGFPPAESGFPIGRTGRETCPNSKKNAFMPLRKQTANTTVSSTTAGRRRSAPAPYKTHKKMPSASPSVRRRGTCFSFSLILPDGRGCFRG